MPRARAQTGLETIGGDAQNPRMQHKGERRKKNQRPGHAEEARGSNQLPGREGDEQGIHTEHDADRRRGLGKCADEPGRYQPEPERMHARGPVNAVERDAASRPDAAGNLEVIERIVRNPRHDPSMKICCENGKAQPERQGDESEESDSRANAFVCGNGQSRNQGRARLAGWIAGGNQRGEVGDPSIAVERPRGGRGPGELRCPLPAARRAVAALEGRRP